MTLRLLGNSQYIRNAWESKLMEELKDNPYLWDPTPKPPLTRRQRMRQRWENFKTKMSCLRFGFYYRWPYGDVGRPDDD